jgi:hypothetical protein
MWTLRVARGAPAATIDPAAGHGAGATLRRTGRLCNDSDRSGASQGDIHAHARARIKMQKSIDAGAR